LKRTTPRRRRQDPQRRSPGLGRPEVTVEEGLAAVETATRIVEAMGKQAL
jgi:hypothetical protein